MPLAYLPQRVAEIMYLTFAVPLFAKGVQTIVTGRLREWAWPFWRVRTLGLLLAACGTGIGLFAFLVDQEPPALLVALVDLTCFDDRRCDRRRGGRRRRSRFHLYRHPRTPFLM